MEKVANEAGRIAFDVDTMEWNNMTRKRAFYTGVPMVMQEKWSETEFESLEDFKMLPDVLPIRPKEKFTDLDYKALMKWEKPWTPEEKKGEDEEGTPQGPPVDQHLF